MGSKWTDKKRIFVKEYLVDKNATRAAKVAGYSEKTAYSAGCRLLKDVEVAAAVAEGLKRQEDAARKRAERRQITRERWEQELELIAFANMNDFATVTDNGLELIPTADRPKRLGRVIKKVTKSYSESTRETESSSGARSKSTSVSSNQSVELWDKLKALHLLGEARGWAKKKIEISGPGGGPIEQSLQMTPEERQAELEKIRREQAILDGLISGEAADGSDPEKG